MRRMSQLFAAIIGLCFVGVACVPEPSRGAAPPQPFVFPKGVAATVNGHPIYEAVVRRVLEGHPPASRAEMRLPLIEDIAKNLLIDLSLKAAGYKVEAAEVEKRVSDMKAELKKVGRDFNKMLADLKVAEKELREHTEADLRWSKYAAAQATDGALLILFDENKEMFDGTTVKAKHILIATKANASLKEHATSVKRLKAIRAAIEQEVSDGLKGLPNDTGADKKQKERNRLLSEAFSKQARKESACPSGEGGGELSAFPRAGYMVEPFARAAFALKPYEMSDSVQTQFGYHLILVAERKEGNPVKFEDMKDQVREVFFDRLRASLAAQLRQKAIVRVNPSSK